MENEMTKANMEKCRETFEELTTNLQRIIDDDERAAKAEEPSLCDMVIWLNSQDRASVLDELFETKFMKYLCSKDGTFYVELFYEFGRIAKYITDKTNETEDEKETEGA